MITGYNTDIPHAGLVFHVQTEDKGLNNPFVETLVYFKGQILAAKRSSYSNLLAEGKGEKEILALMENQHRRVIVAIRAGKFDDKLEALRGSTAQVNETFSGAPPGSSEVGPPDDPLVTETDRSLDQVILDYLSSEADQEQLLLFVDGDQELTQGAPATLAVRASSSKSGSAVVGAHVSVKMISTVTEPCTLAAGQTDQEGRIRLPFDIPRLEQGKAALIIGADSNIGSAEIKHLL